MTAVAKLPELPEPEGSMKWTRSAGVCINPEPGYTADQMREYALAALSPAELGGVEEGVEAIQRLLDCAELAVGFRGFQADDDNEVVVLRDAIREAKPHIVSLSTPRAAEAVAVDDPMIYRFRFAYEGCPIQPSEHERVRIALTASLTPPSAKGE